MKVISIGAKRENEIGNIVATGNRSSLVNCYLSNEGQLYDQAMLLLHFTLTCKKHGKHMAQSKIPYFCYRATETESNPEHHRTLAPSRQQPIALYTGNPFTVNDSTKEEAHS